MAFNHHTPITPFMIPLRILIVEDEIVIARDLEEQLKTFGYTIVGIAKNSKVAIRKFSELQPDMILMDIVLKNSDFNGVQLAKIFNNIRRIPIIYLTGSHSSRIYEEAKETSPANYLIKPCNEKQLEAAIELAIYNFSNQKEASLKPQLISNQQKVFSASDYIFIRDKELFIKISIDNLLWVKAANTYVEVFTVEDYLMIATSLKSFLQQFQHPHLQRIHRSYAANLSKVYAFDGGNLYIHRAGKPHRIPVAPNNREAIFKQFPKLKTKPKP